MVALEGGKLNRELVGHLMLQGIASIPAVAKMVS